MARGELSVVEQGYRAVLEVLAPPGQPRAYLCAVSHAKAAARLFRVEAFDVSDGGVVSFRCHGAMIWPTYVASILKPDLAISLRPA